jgi:hypothetical protein
MAVLISIAAIADQVSAHFVTKPANIFLLSMLQEHIQDENAEPIPHLIQQW